MLADPTHALAKDFEVYIEADGVAERGSFIVNPEGKIVAYEVNAGNVGRNADELLRKVQACQFVHEHGDEVCPAKWAARRRDPEAQPGPGRAAVHGLRADSTTSSSSGAARRASPPGCTWPGPGTGWWWWRRSGSAGRSPSPCEVVALPGRGPHASGAELGEAMRQSGRVVRGGVPCRRRSTGVDVAGDVKTVRTSAGGAAVLGRALGHRAPTPGMVGFAGGGGVPGPGGGVLRHVLDGEFFHRQGGACGGRRLRRRGGERLPHQIRPPCDHPHPGGGLLLRPAHRPGGPGP